MFSSVDINLMDMVTKFQVNDAVIYHIGTYGFLAKVEFVDQYGDAHVKSCGHYLNIMDRSPRKVGYYKRYLLFFKKLVRYENED